MFPTLTTENTLPKDGDSGTLIGRAWLPEVNGPAVVLLLDGEVFDISQASATMSDLLNFADPLAAISAATGNNNRISRKSSGEHIPRPFAMIANLGLSPLSICKQLKPAA